MSSSLAHRFETWLTGQIIICPLKEQHFSKKNFRFSFWIFVMMRIQFPVSCTFFLVEWKNNEDFRKIGYYLTINFFSNNSLNFTGISFSRDKQNKIPQFGSLKNKISVFVLEKVASSSNRMIPRFF